MEQWPDRRSGRSPEDAQPVDVQAREILFVTAASTVRSLTGFIESAGEPISNKHRKTQRRNISCCPLMLSAWRKDAYRANWRYRAGGDGILLPEPRAGACRPELRVGTEHRS